MNTNLAEQANQLINSGEHLIALSTNLSGGAFDTRTSNELTTVGSNILIAGQKVLYGITNSPPGSTSSPAECGILWPVILCMVIAVAIGSVALFAYQRAATSMEKIEKTDFFLIVGMGIGAVALVPALLRTTSSNLIANMKSSTEDRLIFVGFCVAATFAARHFLGTIPQKLIDSIAEAKIKANEANVNAEKANARAEKADTKAEIADTKVNSASIQIDKVKGDAHKALEVVAARTGRDVQPITQENIVEGAPELNEDLALVLKAFADPRFSDFRTVIGLALDSGLTPKAVKDALSQLHARGEVTPVGSQTQDQWRLTDNGTEMLQNLPVTFKNIAIEHTGHQ